MVILHVALHGESESLGVSWSFEVGLRVQKCAVVLSSSVPSGLTSPCAFLLRLKEMPGLIYCLLGFLPGMTMGKIQELAYLLGL